MVQSQGGVFSECLKAFGSRLTSFEHNEILDYNDVWFLGLEGKKIQGVPGASQNCGYDDENGSYIKVRRNKKRFDRKF